MFARSVLNNQETYMLGQRLMWVAWPAFLVAAVLEMLIFAVVDPTDLHWAGGGLDLSREAVYTVTFFVLWGFTMLSSSLTTLLSMSPFEVNRCPVPADQRPVDCAKTCEGSCQGS
jgi:hypothetical protein